MKVLFKNTTKYDKENCNNFINFHAKKYGKKELLKNILIVICVIYILIFNLINRNWYLILIIIVLCALLCLINNKKIEKEKKEKKKIKEFTFYFYERYIKIKYRRQFERMTYFEIKKIFETDENFFLYTDEKHSMILDKEGFDIGTSKEFSQFIRRKCPLRYGKEKK